jgi:cysteinyl-tRNA synthetase
LSEFSRSLDLLGLAPRVLTTKVDTTEVDALVSERLIARAARNWKESDRIRDELDAMGVSIKDNKDGTTSWEVKR